MALTSANYVFLPWVRQGAAGDIQTIDGTAGQAGFVSVNVNLRVNDSAADAIDQQVRLYGPGDVIGMDPKQVVRTVPAHLSTDFEPNYFPAIEFDRPDFPWLFTPAKADGSNKLRPWLCLIVVRKQLGVTLSRDRANQLPVLEIASPANPDLELPNLSESWAWAHAQVVGAKRDFESLKNSLAGDPALTLSRLLCPRRLDPATDYLACLVPAFALGVKKGLGIPIQHDDQHDEEKSLEPAWTIGAQSSVRLPVYFDWEFRTGIGGDFESLVGLLTARALDASVGKKPVDISQAFEGQPAPPATGEGMTLELQGALRVVRSEPAEWPKDVRDSFQTALQEILNTPAKQATPGQPQANEDPILAPPIYGSWQAARHLVNVKPTQPQPLNWLDELNLEPRHRASAAIGTNVVQTEQEQLMASAWEQLGDLKAINQLRRQAQLGRAVNVVYHSKHFSRFSEETLLKVLAPAQSRVVVEAMTGGDKRALLSQKIAQSGIPVNASSAPLRRLTSARGPVNARFKPAVASPIAFMTRMTFRAAVPVKAGPVTMSQVSNALAGRPDLDQLKQTLQIERTSQVLDTAPQLGTFAIAAEGTLPHRTLLNFQQGQTDSADARMFRTLVKAQQSYLGQLFAPPKTTLPQVSFNLFNAGIKEKLLQSVNPEKTILARVQAADSTELNGDQLEPILDAPEFPRPMYEALRDVAPEFLFFGMQSVPENTVTVLETNPPFVESFMVGLNAEMGHELLWRNYPTDQRGTYFRQFWDTSVDKSEPDMNEINTWSKNHLGQNLTRGSGTLVLLIRGELLRRYPNSVIYAVKAVKEGGTLGLSTAPADERSPIFRGTMKPDITFVGFNLTEAAALGRDPAHPQGWFFVIQEQPTEPRFGLDIADFVKPPQPPPLVTWDDLSWRHLASTEAELKAMSHASVKTVLQNAPKARWGVDSNSAHHAYITLQRPVRIAIHANQMIKTIAVT